MGCGSPLTQGIGCEDCASHATTPRIVPIVVLGLAGRHKRHGRQFTARIDLKVPGAEIVINKEHDEDVQVALRDAFDAARRKLEDFGREQRGDVKQHSHGLT